MTQYFGKFTRHGYAEADSNSYSLEVATVLVDRLRGDGGEISKYALNDFGIATAAGSSYVCEEFINSIVLRPRPAIDIQKPPPIALAETLDKDDVMEGLYVCMGGASIKVRSSSQTAHWSVATRQFGVHAGGYFSDSDLGYPETIQKALMRMMSSFVKTDRKLSEVWDLVTVVRETGATLALVKDESKVDLMELLSGQIDLDHHQHLMREDARFKRAQEREKEEQK
jgi:hypothetical protein